MSKVRVELLIEGTNEMLQYDVVTKEEALKAIDSFNIAETLVDYVSSQLGCTIEIDLETGEVYTKQHDGTFYLGDTTLIRFIADIEAYDDLGSLSEIVEGYDNFRTFEEQYEDWENEKERKYDFEFNDDKYRDVYEAYVVEVLKKDIEKFHRSELINTMDENINCGIYEDTEKFYDEAKVITEL